MITTQRALLLTALGVMAFSNIDVIATATAVNADGGTNSVVEQIEVKRAKNDKAKHPSLRFLHDNRVFIRGRLDQLRLQVKLIETDTADLLNERYLLLQEMAASIAAARDSVSSEYDSTATRTLLTSITELGALEAELDFMERVLTDQQGRLLTLEKDFLGHQETALVILVKGPVGKKAPSAIILSSESEEVRVNLDEAQRDALNKGGIAQVYHKFVEPREHVFAVSFLGEAWDRVLPIEILFETERDRITFLEIDLSRLDSTADYNDVAVGLLTSVWYR